MSVYIPCRRLYTEAVCQSSGLRSLRRLCEALLRLDCDIKSSSVYYSGDFCLLLSIRTRELISLRPIICEHSDRVIIGGLCSAVAAEHMIRIIDSGAARLLSD